MRPQTPGQPGPRVRRWRRILPHERLAVLARDGPHRLHVRRLPGARDAPREASAKAAPDGRRHAVGECRDRGAR